MERYSDNMRLTVPMTQNVLNLTGWFSTVRKSPKGSKHFKAITI